MTNEKLIDGQTENDVLEMVNAIAKDAYTKGYIAGMEATKKTFEAKSKMVPVKSPNQQRAELIQRAREFVEGQKVLRPRNNPLAVPTYIAEEGQWCDVEFVVNAEKRTVVALLRWRMEGNVVSKGIAKCHPDEVFNADIGKAIALARALEIDIPVEFLEAVQPTEIVVGMLIRRRYALSTEYYERIVSKVGNKEVRYSDGGYDFVPGIHESGFSILDDTNAIYEEVAE